MYDRIGKRQDISEIRRIGYLFRLGRRAGTTFAFFDGTFFLINHHQKMLKISTLKFKRYGPETPVYADRLRVVAFVRLCRIIAQQKGFPLTPREKCDIMYVDLEKIYELSLGKPRLAGSRMRTYSQLVNWK